MSPKIFSKWFVLHDWKKKYTTTNSYNCTGIFSFFQSLNNYWKSGNFCTINLSRLMIFNWLACYWPDVRKLRVQKKSLKRPVPYFYTEKKWSRSLNQAWNQAMETYSHVIIYLPQINTQNKLVRVVFLLYVFWTAESKTKLMYYKNFHFYNYSHYNTNCATNVWSSAGPKYSLHSVKFNSQLHYACSNKMYNIQVTLVRWVSYPRLSYNHLLQRRRAVSSSPKAYSQSKYSLHSVNSLSFISPVQMICTTSFKSSCT